MTNKKYTKISENKRIYILSAFILAVFAVSIVSIIVLRVMRKPSAAEIFVDGAKYLSIDLTSSSDMEFTITNSAGAACTIEILNHDIRIKEADCPNHLCIHRGWASESIVPIVCLPNNIVITVISSSQSDSREDSIDAITY